MSEMRVSRCSTPPGSSMAATRRSRLGHTWNASTAELAAASRRAFVGRLVFSLSSSTARASEPMTERQLAPTRRFCTSVRTRYRVSQSLQRHAQSLTPLHYLLTICHAYQSKSSAFQAIFLDSK